MPNFESPIAQFLYQLAPDEECGTLDGIGWHGLYLGDLGTDEPEFADLTPEEQDELRSSEAAIVFEADNHVEVSLFASAEEAEDIWETIEDDAEEEGVDSDTPSLEDEVGD